MEINPNTSKRYAIPQGVSKAAVEIPDLETGILPSLPSKGDEYLYDVYSAFPKGPLVGKYISGDGGFFAKQTSRSSPVRLEEACDVVGSSSTGSVLGLIGGNAEVIPAVWRKFLPNPIGLDKPSGIEGNCIAPLGVGSGSAEFVIGVGGENNKSPVEGVYWELSECHMSRRVEAAGPLEDFCDSDPWLRRVPMRVCEGGYVIARTKEGIEVLKHK